MARELTYYNAGDGRRKGRRRGSVVDRLAMVFSVVVAVGVVVSWLARPVNPADYGVLSVAGLLMPALFVANFLCLLYWVIRWRRGVFIPLVVFVCGFWNINLFFRPGLTLRHGGSVGGNSTVNVMSYNVQGMMRSADLSSLVEVASVVDSLRPDILCIQEFQSTAQNPAGRFEALLPTYHYKRVQFNIRNGGGGGSGGSSGGGEEHGWGNAIYSKFPITGSGHIDFEGTNNSILWADIAVRRDTVRVFCAHLQTTAIKASDERYIVEGDFVGDDTRNSQMKRMADKLTRGNVVRAGQADTLAASIANSPYPVIVCGDFNDTPVSYSYRRIARHLEDSFREAGVGYGYTYRGFFNLLRIDYVLHSPGMECVKYVSPSFDNSDHNPVAVRLRF